MNVARPPSAPQSDDLKDTDASGTMKTPNSSEMPQKSSSHASHHAPPTPLPVLRPVLPLEPPGLPKANATGSQSHYDGMDLLPPQPMGPLSSPQWPDRLTSSQQAVLSSVPCALLILLIILLRLIWKPKAGPKFRLPTNVPTYGAIIDSADENQQSYEYDGEANDLIYADHFGGRCDEYWLRTFEFAFVVIVVALFVTLVVLTSTHARHLWSEPLFYLSLVTQFLLISAVSLLGGILARFLCFVEDDGYIVSERNWLFKVNYTRKIQQLAVFLVPLQLNFSHSGAAWHASSSMDQEPLYEDLLVVAWGFLVVLITFVLLIRPFRERSLYLMLQFNCLDRPEDRPNTFKWAILGQLLPTMVLLYLFRWLFSRTDQTHLMVLLILLVTVPEVASDMGGILFGKHKVTSTICLTKRKITKTMEASACFFLIAMVLAILSFRDFETPVELYLTMASLPVLLTYGHSVFPRSIDTPLMVAVAGLLLYLFITIA